MVLQIVDSPIHLAQRQTAMVTPPTDAPTQPEIICEEEGDVDMNESDDEDEGKELLEDELRRLQKVDSVATIASMRRKPEELSRFKIPLCRLIPMPMVRPTLSSDILKLEQEFAHGYNDGRAAFYVSTTNEAGESQEFTSDEMNGWDDWWKVANAEFLAFLESKPELQYMKNLKFFICDGNHRRIAWMNHITRKYTHDRSWHISVDSIVLETKGKIELVMQIMHDINK